MQYICEHRHIEMSEHYVRILVYMASAFGWPVRANGQCATYSKGIDYNIIYSFRPAT